MNIFFFSYHDPARLSKRSIVAVGIFMLTGILSASLCSPKCKLIGFLYTNAESGIDAYYPNKLSPLYSDLLIAIFVAITIISSKLTKKESDTFQEEETITLLLSSKQESNTFQVEENSRNNKYSKGPIAMVSAITFSAGLFISGMTKNYKIHDFLDLTLIPKGYWDPTLAFVMSCGLLFSMLSYQFVPKYNLLKVCLLINFFLLMRLNNELCSSL